jgi:hypothetical protein
MIGFREREACLQKLNQLKLKAINSAEREIKTF